LVQFPLAHWSLSAHEPPLATWATQEPPVQYLPEPQGTTLLAVQAPAPLHTEAVLTDKSPLHEAALHNVPLPG
jgi:hypothetical protein